MRTAGSILLLIILVPATVVVFAVSSLKLNVLTARFITHELAARNTYGIVEEQASKEIGKITLKDVPINSGDLQVLVKRVLPASWLQSNVESIINRTFEWFNAPEGALLSVPIDFRGPKAELIPGVDALIQSAIPKMKECPKKHDPTELCRVPGMTVAQVKDILKLNNIDIASATTQLPDSIDLAHPVLPEIKLGNDSTSSDNEATDTKTKTDDKKNTADEKKIDDQKKDDGSTASEMKPKKTPQEQADEITSKLSDAKKKYHDILRYWNYTLVGFGLLILGFIAINIHGWRRLTRWTGILMMTIGTLPAAIGFGSRIVMDRLLPTINFGSTPTDVQTAALGAIRDVQYALFSPIMITGIVLVVLGIGAIIGAHFISKPKNDHALHASKK